MLSHMRVLLTGAEGMLGRAVHIATPAGVTVVPTTIATLDITDAKALTRMLETRFDWVINCAAYTRVDDAESNEALAHRVNADAVGLLGRTAAAQGTRVLHISTDYVFDGRQHRPYREDDPPRPLGAYGRSKRAGELALEASGCAWTLVRTQWLYGGGPSFVRAMWQNARASAPVRVVNDQFGAPTHTAELADVIWRLMRGAKEGIWHATAGGCTSWYEVARAVYTLVGANTALITPCTTIGYGAVAPRPRNGCLDCSKLGGMRQFHEVLTEALHASTHKVAGP